MNGGPAASIKSHGAEGNRTIAGHLHRATVKTYFVNAYTVSLRS